MESYYFLKSLSPIATQQGEVFAHILDINPLDGTGDSTRIYKWGLQR